MEGSLSKWTNVVHGWQYRYFVLDEDVLRYYTSKEKMLKGQIRGCIHLRGAVVGIEGGSNPLFTITVDGKVFHLQGRDTDERDAWVRELERVIHEKCGYYNPQQEDPLVELSKKISHAEQQSQTLVEQVKKLEQIDQNSEKADKKQKKVLSEVIKITKNLQHTVDLSVVMLGQVQRHFGLDTSTTSSNGSNRKDDDAADMFKCLEASLLKYKNVCQEFHISKEES